MLQAPNAIGVRASVSVCVRVANVRVEANPNKKATHIKYALLPIL